MISKGSRVAHSAADTPIYYATAVGAAALALACRRLLDPFLVEFTSFITLYVAVALCAIYVGLGPSIVAAALGMIGAAYGFVAPRGSFAPSSVAHIVGTLTYLVVCGLVIFAGETSRRSTAKVSASLENLQRREEDLRTTREQLEERVRQRTLELEAAEVKFKGCWSRRRMRSSLWIE